MSRRAALRRACLAALLAPGAAAAAPGAPPLEVGPATGAIVVDGRLDEPLWDDAARVELAHEVFPGDNTQAEVRTVVRLAHTHDTLYVAFVAEDPEPAAIRAHYTDRDDAFRNDLVGFVLDPFHDERRGFAFLANPLGVQLDAVIDEVAGSGTGFRSLTGAAQESYDWDAIWYAAGQITADGYVVEFAVPFHALRFPRSAEGGTWGFVAVRQRPRTLRRRLSSEPLDRDRACFLCQLRDVSGFPGIEPGRDVELNPTLTARSTDAFDPATGARTGSSDETDAGLTAHWGLTPYLTLAGTLDPDFSQVEADAAQLESNRRFALFFDEKRPFFLEGQDVFGTPLFAVFTRTLAEPEWGLKLTGKQGRHTVGAFVVEDERTSLLFPANEGSSALTLDAPYTGSALRYRLDVGSTSTLGVLGTSREGTGYSNVVGGIDGNVRLSATDRVRFQWLRSATRYPEPVFTDAASEPTGLGQPRGRFRGDGLLVEYEHEGREWEWKLATEDLEPTFRADLGFEPRVDMRKRSASVERIHYGSEGSFLNRVRYGARAERVVDWTGRLTDEAFELTSRLDGPYQSFLSLTARIADGTLSGQRFDEDGFSAFFNVRPSGTFTSSFRLRTGSAIDVANARQARELMIEPEMTLNLGRRFFTQARHMMQRLSVPAGALSRENLSQATMNYHFGLRSFVRAIVQYRRTDRELARYSCLSAPPGESCDLAAEERSLFTQLLFSYKLNPRTVVFVGSTETRRAEGGAGLETSDRTLFVKLGYAWLL